jgi:hypothetical protein
VRPRSGTSSLEIELRLHPRIQASTEPVCSTGLIETANTAERVVYENSMINEVAKMMEINARNMVALHFLRRLHKYIRFRYAPQRELQLKSKDTKRLVDSCY